MNDPYRQVVVFADGRPMLARMLCDRLQEAGINAFVDNEDSWQGMGDLPGSMIEPPQVVVAAADEEQARAIVAEFQAEEKK